LVCDKNREFVEVKGRETDYTPLRELCLNLSSEVNTLNQKEAMGEL